MNKLLLEGAIAVVIINLFLGLLTTATSVSEKTQNFADDMNSVLDCAFMGEELSKCNSEINKSVEDSINANKDTLSELKGVIESYDELYHPE